LRDQKALQKLIQLRATDDLELRQAAINAIGALRSEESYAALAQIFETGEWRDRRAVIESLHQDSSPNALKIIKIALGDRDWQVRLAVTEWVDYRIEWAQPGREVLSALCKDTWESVAAAARTRLQRLEDFLSREARERHWEPLQRGAAPTGGAVKPTAPYDADEQVSAATSPNDIAPISITDRVAFTVTAPTMVPAGTSFLLDVWIHQDDQLQLRDVFDRARRASPTRDQSVRTKGPIAVDRDTILSIRLAIDSFALVLEDRVFWTGEIGNATFPIAVPQDASQGTHIGVASIAANGLLVANVYFEFEVCRAKQRDQAFPERFDITSQEQQLRSAFASYASEDRNRVLARLQGILKALPDLDIFLDVMSLRSGDFWEPRLRKEIKSRDVFYLFWSAAARRSDWVTREWRIALEEKGINYIDPVPLDPPDVAPPPPELAARHFNDGILAFFKAD
jgi:hypothetical protein